MAQGAVAKECLLCADIASTIAIGPCCAGFAVCGECILRQRYLHNNQNCVVCRSPCETIVISRPSETRTLDKFDVDSAPAEKRIVSLGIVFEHLDDAIEYKKLMRLRCPVCVRAGFGEHADKSAKGNAERCFANQNALSSHLFTAHKMLFCDCCVTGRKCFPHEQITFSAEDLKRHLREGEKSKMASLLYPNGLAAIEPHPTCEFCLASKKKKSKLKNGKNVFFSNDELQEHMENVHHLCEVCKRMGHDHQYFRNLKALQRHYKQDHFPCPYKECKEGIHIVFESDIRLRQHLVTVHGEKDKKNVTKEFFGHRRFRQQRGRKEKRLAEIAPSEVRRIAPLSQEEMQQRNTRLVQRMKKTLSEICIDSIAQIERGNGPDSTSTVEEATNVLFSRFRSLSKQLYKGERDVTPKIYIDRVLLLFSNGGNSRHSSSIDEVRRVNAMEIVKEVVALLPNKDLKEKLEKELKKCDKGSASIKLSSEELHKQRQRYKELENHRNEVSAEMLDVQTDFPTLRPLTESEKEERMCREKEKEQKRLEELERWKTEFVKTKRKKKVPKGEDQMKWKRVQTFLENIVGQENDMLALEEGIRFTIRLKLEKQKRVEHFLKIPKELDVSKAGHGIWNRCIETLSENNDVLNLFQLKEKKLILSFCVIALNVLKDRESQQQMKPEVCSHDEARLRGTDNDDNEGRVQKKKKEKKLKKVQQKKIRKVALRTKGPNDDFFFASSRRETKETVNNPNTSTKKKKKKKKKIVLLQSGGRR
eukprot:g508.t1